MSSASISAFGQSLGKFLLKLSRKKSGREEDSFGFLIIFFPKPMQCKDLLTNNGALYTKRNFMQVKFDNSLHNMKSMSNETFHLVKDMG